MQGGQVFKRDALQERKDARKAAMRNLHKRKAACVAQAMFKGHGEG
jgi:hypothetical protein